MNTTIQDIKDFVDGYRQNISVRIDVRRGLHRIYVHDHTSDTGFYVKDFDSIPEALNKQKEKRLKALIRDIRHFGYEVIPTITTNHQKENTDA